MALSQGDGWVEFLSRHGGGAPWCGVGGKIGNGQDFVDYFRLLLVGIVRSMLVEASKSSMRTVSRRVWEVLMVVMVKSGKTGWKHG